VGHSCGFEAAAVHRQVEETFQQHRASRGVLSHRSTSSRRASSFGKSNFGGSGLSLRANVNLEPEIQCRYPGQDPNSDTAGPERAGLEERRDKLSGLILDRCGGATIASRQRRKLDEIRARLGMVGGRGVLGDVILTSRNRPAIRDAQEPHRPPGSRSTPPVHHAVQVRQPTGRRRCRWGALVWGMAGRTVRGCYKREEL